MSMRFASLALIPAVVVAGSLAVCGLGRTSPAAIALPAAPVAPAMARGGEPSENGGALPPNHPAIDMGSMNIGSMNGGALPPNHPPIGGAVAPQGSPPPADSAPPAIVWKMPDAWREAPNPNAMRLATYRVPGSVEVSVSRAGGSTDANIQRWLAQFEDIARDTRAEKNVHRLQIVTVDIAGTYVGGGMTMGGPPEPKHDWAMVGAIVESPSPPYFFKMMGPAAAVHAARPLFDRLLETIAPALPSR
jgi:hypothetical protein